MLQKCDFYLFTLKSIFPQSIRDKKNYNTLNVAKAPLGMQSYWLQLHDEYNYNEDVLDKP